MEQAAQGNSGIAMPGSVQKVCELQHLGKELNNEYGATGLMVGCNALGGLFQISQFYGSIMLYTGLLLLPKMHLVQSHADTPVQFFSFVVNC